MPPTRFDPVQYTSLLATEKPSFLHLVIVIIIIVVVVIDVIIFLLFILITRFLPWFPS